MQIRQLNDMWVVVNPSGTAFDYSLSNSENSSIEQFKSGSTEYWWRLRQNEGCRCVKVDISFTVKE